MDYDAEIQTCKHEIKRLEARVADLEADKRLHLARKRLETRAQETLDEVLEGFQQGRAIAVAYGRCWWHQDGKLIRKATPNEMQAAKRLVETGAVYAEKNNRRAA